MNPRRHSVGVWTVGFFFFKNNNLKKKKKMLLGPNDPHNIITFSEFTFLFANLLHEQF